MERIFEFLSDLLYSIYVAVVDAIAAIWPSTPESLKLANILSVIPQDSFMYIAAVEVASTVGVAIGLVGLYKLIKILPFT